MNYSDFNKAESESEFDEYSIDQDKDLIEENSASLLKKRKRRGMKIKRGINCSWTIEEVISLSEYFIIIIIYIGQYINKTSENLQS